MWKCNWEFVGEKCEHFFRRNDGGWTSDTYLKNVQSVKNAVHEYETLLNELKGKDASLVTSDDHCIRRSLQLFF